VARKNGRARKPAARAARGRAGRIAARPAARRAGAVERRAAAMVQRVRPIARMAAGWSTLRVVWQPAIAMATLPYRVYRVYRWAEAESSRSAFSAT
jgi:hypothetical protein